MKKKLFSLIIVPVLTLGLAVIIVALTVVKGSLTDEICDALKSAATATLAAYDQNAGQYIEASNGDIWKGSYNISKSDKLVDTIKDNTGMEVTFFYGDRRIMTSAVDKNGDRILGSAAGDVIKKKVLEDGKEFFSSNVNIDGTMFYGYYVPVRQDGRDEILGMVFVGANKAEKDAAVRKIMTIIVAVTAAIMLLGGSSAIYFTSGITNSLRKGISSVESVASGNLKTKIDEKLLKRHDEIGDLSRSLSVLESEMSKSIELIAGNAKSVWSASSSLENTSSVTDRSMREVEDAVNGIAESATTQAEISSKASENVSDMGNKIEQASSEMSVMKKNAYAMNDSEKKSAATLNALLESNEDVRDLIKKIADQTEKTNESVQKIKEATEIIASIADETSLLSLNASIEAARAGENGKGFAVVAGQIQKLANMSNESSGHIEEIVNALIEDSDNAVKTMEKVQTTIKAQTDSMLDNKRMADEVMEKLSESMKSMNNIEKSISYLDNARKEIVKTVEELSDIARQNAAMTEEVSASAIAVSDNFRRVHDSTEELKNVADGLEGSMKHFSI